MSPWLMLFYCHILKKIMFSSEEFIHNLTFETVVQRGHWESRIYISTDIYLDLTTIQYRYANLLVPRLQNPAPKCKAQIKVTNCNVITMKKLKWGLMILLQWLVLFCVQQTICLLNTGLIYKKCNKILSHRHLKRSRTQNLTSQTQLKNNYLL